MKLRIVPRHHLLIRGGAVAIHSDLATTQPGIILYQIGSVKGEPAINDDDPPLGALIVRHLAHVTGHKALDLPRTETTPENERQESASRNEAPSLTVLEQPHRRIPRREASHGPEH